MKVLYSNIHRRLTLFFTMAAGIILTCVLGIILIVRVNENHKSEVERIKSSWITILSSLQARNQYDHISLAQMEAGNRILIHVEENGNPLLFSGSWTPKTDRDILLSRLKDKFLSVPISSYGSQTKEMELNGDFNDRYYALATIFPIGKGMRHIYLISYIQKPPAGSWVCFLLIVYVCGLSGLWGVGWFFIGKALQPAKAAEEKQKQFIAAASHELRAPLAVINSTLFFLDNGTQEQAKLVNHIDTECKRMSRLIGDMLFLYTADSKTWSLIPEKIDMDSIIIDVYGSFLALCKQKKIHLKLELPESPTATIEGDRQRVEQVLGIVLDNAISHSPAETTITMKLYTETGKRSFNSDSIIVEISDEGSGISDEIKPYIFDRFYCSDYSHSDKEHFGLGLSIAKEIIEMHKGKIYTEDNIPQGTCFKIYLPSCGNFKTY